MKLNKRSLHDTLLAFVLFWSVLVTAEYEKDICLANDVKTSDDLIWSPLWEEPLDAPVVALNNTVERLDYNNTIASILQELRAQVINVTGVPLGQFQSRFASVMNSYWGLHINDRESMLSFSQNHVVNTIWTARSILGDKDGLTLLENYAFHELGEGANGFSPDSFVLPAEITSFSRAVRKSPGDLYMRKRLNTHSGSGVKLMLGSDLLHWLTTQLPCFQRDGDVEDHPKRRSRTCETTDEKIVAQKYVDDPLLVLGHKFDVRWWCVITNLEPLRVYMLRDGYAKVAVSAKYDVHDVDNKCVHVTNNAVQKQCIRRYRVDEKSPIMKLDNSVRSDGFQKAIAPFTAEQLYQGAREVLRKVLRVSAWRMEAQRQLHGIKCKTFQMLAIDVIYDRKTAKAWLLEINTNGYLQTGILKIPGGRDRLKEFFRMTGMVGFPKSKVDQYKQSGMSEEDVLAALETEYKGEWDVLDVPYENYQNEYRS